MEVQPSLVCASHRQRAAAPEQRETRRGRKRFKTGVGLLGARVGVSKNPLKGPTARGARLEHRIRFNKGFKLIGTLVRMAQQPGPMREVRLRLSQRTSSASAQHCLPAFASLL
jgi:hypothetical protein